MKMAAQLVITDLLVNKNVFKYNKLL